MSLNRFRSSCSGNSRCTAAQASLRPAVREKPARQQQPAQPAGCVDAPRSLRDAAHERLGRELDGIGIAEQRRSRRAQRPEGSALLEALHERRADEGEVRHADLDSEVRDLESERVRECLHRSLARGVGGGARKRDDGRDRGDVHEIATPLDQVRQGDPRGPPDAVEVDLEFRSQIEGSTAATCRGWPFRHSRRRRRCRRSGRRRTRRRAAAVEVGHVCDDRDRAAPRLAAILWTSTSSKSGKASLAP